MINNINNDRNVLVDSNLNVISDLTIDEKTTNTNNVEELNKLMDVFLNFYFEFYINFKRSKEDSFNQAKTIFFNFLKTMCTATQDNNIPYNDKKKIDKETAEKLKDDNKHNTNDVIDDDVDKYITGIVEYVESEFNANKLIIDACKNIKMYNQLKNN